MRFGNLFQDALDLAGIGAIGDAHGDDDPAHGVAAGIVGHRARDQIRVRHDDVRAVKRLDPGRADRNAPHIAHLPAHLDPVALGNGPLDQQDDARHEIRHHRLQAKADAHGQRPRHQRNVRQVTASSCDRHKRCKENTDIAKARHHGRLSAGVHLGLGQHR